MYKIIIFDAYDTVFDSKTSFEKLFIQHFDKKGLEILNYWKQKMSEFVMTQSHYHTITSYNQVVSNALKSVFTSLDIELSESFKLAVFETFTHLEAFDDFKEFATEKWFDRVYIYSNGSKQMLDDLKINIDLASKDRIVFLSSENSHSFKPSLKAYTFAKHSIWYPENEILYISCNKWDVMGAKNYGFATCWLNRNGEVFDDNLYFPDHIICNTMEVREIACAEKK